MRTTNERGFTLIELLVVIAIIGMLSSVVLASLNTARAKARDAARVAQIKQVQTALELYYGSNNAYPGDTNWYDNGCHSSYTDINTILGGYGKMTADPGSVCVLYTRKGGITPANGVVLEYYLLFPAETSAVLSQDMDCYSPSTYYCVGAQ